MEDRDLLDALRGAAEPDRPLSTAAYERHRAGAGGPSVAWIIRRFGTWRAACAAAGLPTNEPSARRATWSEEELVAHVASYLAALAPGASGSFADYAAWAKAHPSAPSGATVRARLPWAEAKRRATGDRAGRPAAD
ncbi:hypothetical protein E8D34_06205 [Nocardioides sp. GY 10113]|uniref:homing endonuclease associated repeat-containing protein n=1 Tax=Nocardioides sp. GY 10113 TaxID=2569761 RepID=UPI0010A89A02|nr:hypothetical protein [Nocardioides sp. GY 10113]TIC87890.1 hypothetical protein E8D34_06205 [Nocardioides sp. GY 10113]